MKKLSLLILSSLVSASVLAAPMTNKAFTGPSVGIELGTTKYKVKDTDSSFKNKNTTDINLTGSYGFEYGDSGFIGAVEGKIKPNSSKAFTHDTGNIKEQNRFDINYVQGYRVTDDLMPYAKIGYTQNRFKDSDGGEKETARGYNVGVGAKYAVAPNVELGAEYVHSQVRTKKDSDGDRAKLRGNGFNTGVSYRF